MPARPDTTFLLASLTKTFTASAVLAVVDDGKLALDDPVAKHVPGLPDAWKTVTVRQCLSHTSGLPDVVNADEKTLYFTWEAALPALSTASVQPAGVRTVYNQTAYVLLGLLARQLSGEGFEEFIARRFLRPLEMTSTTYGDQADLVPRCAWMYSAFQPSEDRRWLLMGKNGPVRSADGIFPVSEYFTRGIFSRAPV